MPALALVLAAVVGLSLGLLGGGGSILTVPIFVYVLGLEPKTAIAMSLPVVGVTSLIGAISHWHAGNVRLRPALIFGGVAMVSTFAGARLAAWVSGNLQLLLFSALMLAAAASMLRGRVSAPPAHGEQHDLLRLGLVGLAVGALTGLVGVGGGFMIVPALVLLAGVPMKQAVGTSLLVIALNSLAGFAGYLGQVEVRWELLLRFTAVASLGIVGGTWLVRYVSPAALRRGFAVFLVAIALYMLYRNLGTLGLV